MTERMLEIKGLKIYFGTEEGVLRAVDGVDLGIGTGETLGVVGESGCGKSVTALTVMRLLPMPPAHIAGGEIRWRGRDLVAAGEDAVRELRAKEIAMIFQEPMTSLNPVYTVGDQIAEVVRHILPNAMGPVIVAATIDVANAIIAESTLSFLGLGFPPDIPTWGRVLYDAKDYLDIAPYWALFPGTLIFLTVLSINYVGDGLRDALDPRRIL